MAASCSKNAKSAGNACNRCLVLLVMTLLVVCSGWTFAQNTTAPTEYLLGPQDTLDIFVWKEVDLTRSVIVRPDGGISFPLAGDMQVAGKSVRKVQEEITRKITPYIPEAVVTVSVSKVAGYRIYVIGKVNKPGEYVLGNYVDVAKAISIAAGLNPYAEQANIKVIRHQDGKESVFRFDYGEFTQGKNLSQNIALESGDMVIVP